MNEIQRFYILLLIIACPFLASGQALSDLIPFNKNAVEGQLPNGLQYIIHKNPNPAGKVEFRMVLNVGSVLEEPNETGMSHFLEHMVFNGTKNYPGNKATQLLQEMGIKYGFDLNAFTDNDKTIYIIPVPTDKKENIHTALNILHEWLTSLNLCPSDIEKEKKIVVQEIKDAGIDDVFYPIKVSNSRYADRPVLGTECSIRQFDSLSLRSYYDKWYRPDLATIIAVGDLDTKEMEGYIKNIFSKVTPRIAQVPLRTGYSLSVRGPALLQQEQDTLIGSNKLDIVFPEIINPRITYQDLYGDLLNQLFENMLSARIAKDKQLQCHYAQSWYLSNISHHSFELSAQSDTSIYRAIEQMGYLLAQIKQYGFSLAELKNAKTTLLKNLSKKDFARTSGSFCNNYIDLATAGDRHIGNKNKYTFFEAIMNTISTDEITKQIDIFFAPNHQMLFCYLYHPQRSIPLNKEQILASWNKGLTAAVQEYFPIKENNEQSGIIVQKELIVRDLVQSGIIEEKKYPNIGVTELRLSNGLRVALRPTPGSDNPNIMITLIGKGGFSVLPVEKYPYFSQAAAYVDMGGVDTLDAQTVNELCYEKNIALSTNIDNYSQEMYGIAFEGDIDNLLKLFYLKITTLNKNESDFENDIQAQISAIGKEGLLLKQINRNPDRSLQNRIAGYSGVIHKNNKELETREELLKVDLDDNITFFRQLFGNAENLTAIVTGNFITDSIQPKVVAYLGALPNRNSELHIQDIGNHFPEGIQREFIEDPDASRANITTLIHGQYQHTFKETIIFKIMRDIINNRMLQSLREKEGLVYSPYITVSYRVYPRSEFYFNINYSCDNENIPLLEKLLWTNLESLRETPVIEKELNSIKQSFLISKREHLSESNTAEWRDKLKEMYLENGSVSDLDNYDQILSDISAEDIQNSFRKYIDPNRFMTISISKNQ